MAAVSAGEAAPFEGPAETTDTVLLPQTVLRHALESGLDPDRLTRDCGLAGWQTTDQTVRTPSGVYLRTWEVVEHALGREDSAMLIADRYVMGEAGLHDYLFSTAPTLGAGMATVGPFIGAISTNFHFDPGPETDTEISFEITMINGEGRGKDLAMQWGHAALLARSRLATGVAVRPVRIAFRQSAPRRYASMVETLGTHDIEFNAPADSLTLRKSDLDLPLRTADPHLAAILHRVAASMPAAPPRATTWLEHLAEVISIALDDNSATLDRVARRMFLSRRSLQRRLAEHDTTWRAELDRVRRHRFESVIAGASITRSKQAVLLGYEDHRSVRRAARRWDRAQVARTDRQ
ncbi:AraC family transcriptional regulator ligand-binding domain-containing protein [Nocardia sp. NPDC056100]|uniref:AraC family transcriptional regulator ligand-binding domain-containing protein n=1 Tax=Nocardia sp. NPDC056100 TaxID=3345712 RepID=UPI0035D69D2B